MKKPTVVGIQNGETLERGRPKCNFVPRWAN